MLFQKMMYQILQLLLYLVKKAEQYSSDAIINALKLRLGELPAILASNMQNHFVHLPAQEHPTILTKSWKQWLSFRSHQSYTYLN